MYTVWYVTNYFYWINNILETITEVLCLKIGSKCGGSEFYTCKQMKSKMLVAFTEPVLSGDTYDWRVRSVRNVTVNMGCSCVYRAPVFLDFIPGPQEWRSCCRSSCSSLPPPPQWIVSSSSSITVVRIPSVPTLDIKIRCTWALPLNRRHIP